MIQKNRKRTICLVLIVLNVAFIWGNSLLPGQLSGAFSEKVMEVCKWMLQPILSLLGEDSVKEMLPGDGMYLLRKTAHFSEYLLLGMNFSWLFLSLGETGIHRFAMPLLAGTLTALLDETIQLSTPGRSGNLVDVWIDTAGLTLGIILVLTGYSIWTKGKQNAFGG